MAARSRFCFSTPNGARDTPLNCKQYSMDRSVPRPLQGGRFVVKQERSTNVLDSDLHVDGVSHREAQGKPSNDGGPLRIDHFCYVPILINLQHKFCGPSSHNFRLRVF